MSTNVPFSMAAPPPPPPTRHATVRAIPNPATVPASLPSTSSSSSRMNAARDRAQSWRGKYLRALNICPEDIEIARRNANKAAADGRPRVRALSFHRSTDYTDGHLSLSRSYSSSTEKEDEERKSLERSTRQQLPHHPQQHHIRAVPLRAPSTTLHRGTSGTTMMTTTTTMMPMAPSASNPYGFPMRPNKSRGRRCHTDPFELEDRVSAPIQIPSGPVGNNQHDGNARHHDAYASGGGVGARRRTSPQPALGDNDNGSGSRTDVRLLSWEEPVAMLAAGDALSKGWRVPHGSVMSAMELGVRRARRDEDVDDPSAHGVDDFAHDDDDDTASHGGDIFAMDESDDEDADAAARDKHSMAGPSGKSRRRYRTESMNVVSSGREKRTHHAYDDDVDVDFDRRRQELSQSFVPPHQMVGRRDCFSIGLRDELKKRRPTNHI